MAPILLKRVLDSSLRTLAEPHPRISRRTNPNTDTSAAVFAIPVAIAVSLILIACWMSVRPVQRNRARNKGIPVSLPRDLGAPRRGHRPQAPPPVSDDIIDPPPPYVPLQTMEPAHQPTGPDTLVRPADTERSGGNHGHVRSMLEV
jgi:hypothetical protein